jgi:disulfide bond formation protein DsbB
MDLAQTGTLVLSTLTVLAQATIAGLVILKLMKSGALKRIQPFLLPLAFAVALAAMLGSLFYSVILGYIPCELCWWQRILMYPQSLMLGVMLFWKKDARPFVLPMSAIGLSLSLYHYGLQVASKLNPAVSCPATGVSCTAGVTFTFGYISIPLMAATAFLFILVSMSGKALNQKH